MRQLNSHMRGDIANLASWAQLLNLAIIEALSQLCTTNLQILTCILSTLQHILIVSSPKSHKLPVSTLRKHSNVRNSLPDKITCELSNLIYIINWNRCGLKNTRETKRPIRNRMYEHYSSVQNSRLKRPLQSLGISHRKIILWKTVSCIGWGIQQTQMQPSGTDAKNYIIFRHSLHSIQQVSTWLYKVMLSHCTPYPGAPSPFKLILRS